MACSIRDSLTLITHATPTLDLDGLVGLSGLEHFLKIVVVKIYELVC